MRIKVPQAIYGGDFRAVNEQVITEYRANGGALDTVFADAPILLLTHRRARSGRTYTSPLAYTRAGDVHVIIGSMGGAPVDPQWCRNLVAHPDVEIEVGARSALASPGAKSTSASSPAFVCLGALADDSRQPARPDGMLRRIAPRSASPAAAAVPGLSRPRRRISARRAHRVANSPFGQVRVRCPVGTWRTGTD
jgi:deazaflavin-dependent oxidoreductase (nitroreductase family)